jgi:PTS system glucose-specific IIC component
VVRDEQKINEDKLKAEGIAAVVRLPNKTCHLLAGLNADQYATEMREHLAV